MEHAPLTRISHEEYKRFDRAAEVRHEYFDGVVRPLPSSTLRRAQIKARLYLPFGAVVGQSHCILFNSDARVRVRELDYTTYPDFSVVCGPIEASVDDADALTNPALLVEVLSDSTEAYVRGEKFRRYRALESLRHYVLVSTQRSLIEHYARQDDGAWVLRTYGPGEHFTLDHPPISVSVDELYADLPDYVPPAPDSREAASSA